MLTSVRDHSCKDRQFVANARPPQRSVGAVKSASAAIPRPWALRFDLWTSLPPFEGRGLKEAEEVGLIGAGVTGCFMVDWPYRVGERHS
jgi:hypothetical protein